MKIEIDHENRFRINPENDAEKIYLDNLRGKTFKVFPYRDGDAVVVEQERLNDQDFYYTSQDPNGKIINHKMSPAEQYESIQKYRSGQEEVDNTGRKRYGFEI